jgi:hypothetical protein
MRHADAVTDAEATILGAALAVAGGFVAQALNAWSSRRKDRAAARQERDRAIAELLVATADLMSGLQAIRASYDRSRWRDRTRRVARIAVAIFAAFADENGLITRTTLGDMRNRTAGIERLLVLDAGMSDEQRRQALDMTSVLLPRTSRFFAAVVVLSLGDDQELADAVRKLTPAITDLMEVTGANDRKYARARTRAENAVGRFRDVVDRRRR